MRSYTGMQPHDGILFSPENKRAARLWTDMRELCMHIPKRKRLVRKAYTRWDSIYMAFWKRQINGENEKIGGCPGWAGGEVNRQITEVVKSVLSMGLQGWVPAVTHWSRPTGCTQWGGDLRQAVDSAWWWCVCGGSSLVRNVPYVWAEGVWEISEVPSQFCLSLKLLLKIKFLFKSQVTCLKKYF